MNSAPDSILPVEPSETSLLATCELAQAEASRFLDDVPVRAWKGPHVLRVSRLAVWLVASAAMVGALAAAAVELTSRHAPSARADPRVAATADVALDDVTNEPPPTTPKVPIDSLPLRRLSISVDGGLWRIEAHEASRLKAARELARMQATELSGPTSPLAAARPLTLSWQGRDVMTAWRLVLGDETSYVLQCRRSRCVPIIVPSMNGAEDAAQRSVATPHGCWRRALLRGCPGDATARAPRSAGQPRGRTRPSRLT